MAPTGSQPFPPTYSRTPQPLTARHSEAQKNHPTTLTVTGGTTTCGRWNSKPLQVDIFVHHLPRKIATGAFQCRRWQRFLPTCNVPASHLPRKSATGAFQCCRWQRFLPTCNVPACHLPRKIATGAFQCRRWQRFLPTCSGTAVHLRHHGFPPATVHHPTCNGGWDTDDAGEAMPVWGL